MSQREEGVGHDQMMMIGEARKAKGRRGLQAAVPGQAVMQEMDWSHMEMEIPESASLAARVSHGGIRPRFGLPFPYLLPCL